MDKKKVFLLIGRSCSGKTTIAKGICEKLNLQQVKSYTTRPMRTKETPEESDHIFILKDEIDQYSNDIAAWTSINGYEYFTTKEIINNCDVYVVDPKGLEDLKRRCADLYEFVTIYVRVPKSVGKRRAEQRGEGLESYLKRYDMENEQFAEYERKATWDYHILNAGTIQEAISKGVGIVSNEMMKHKRGWDKK